MNAGCSPRRVFRSHMKDQLSLAKMLSDTNAFEISGIQKDETEAEGESKCNNVTLGLKTVG